MNADGLVVTYYVADSDDSHLITTEDLQNVVFENDEDMSSDFGYEVGYNYNSCEQIVSEKTVKCDSGIN